MADWDQLLQQSERLASQDNHGFPRFERDINQVELLSSQLKSKTQALVEDDNIFAATRLLAQEGVDSRMIDRALDTVEIQPTYEDVFNLETDSVEEYLERVHEMTVISTIQAVQRECEESFQDFMAQTLQSEWEQHKRRLFSTTFADRTQPGGAIASSPGNQLALPASGGSESGIVLGGREKDYVEAVRRMNEANLARQPIDIVTDFHSAADRDVSDAGMKTTVTRVWAVLQSILTEAKASPGNNRTRTRAMLRGAARYLETGHAQFIQTSLQANRSQAHLGGVPSHKGQVQAFMRLRYKDSGPFDFDTPGGQDTTWQRVFICLRSGYYNDACEIAERASRSLLLDGSSLAGHLTEWVTNNRQLTPQATSTLVEECERIRLTTDRSKWQKPQFQFKFAIQTLLCGSRKAADLILRECPSVFGTIEDFMWFMTSLVQTQSGLSSSSPLRVNTGPDPLSELYKLQDLQNYIVQFPSAHYSQGGKEPLLYATVLLLSLQFKAAIAFLAKDPSARSYRLEAPHIAIALLNSKALGAGGEGDSGTKQGVNVGELIHAYGAQFVARAPDIALEYYILAAESMGNDKQTKAQLLKELLTESNAFGFLLGAGGNTGGALEKWIGTGREKTQMLEAVAYSCQQAGQVDWASELYLFAGAPRPALNLLNLQISNVLEAAVSSAPQQEELESLLRRGSEAVNLLSSSTDASEEVEVVAFRQLQTIYQLLQNQRSGNSSKGIELLRKLDFIPLDSFRLSRCTEAIGSLHDAVAQRIPALLLAAAKLLAAVEQVAQLRTVVTFAGNLPQRVSQGTFQELNNIYNNVS